MDESYTRCIVCNAQLGTMPSSRNHARTLNTFTYPQSFAWCHACGKVTRYDSSAFAKFLGRWGIYIPGTMTAVESMDLDDVAKHHHHYHSPKTFERNYVRQTENYPELMFFISRCFVERAGEDAGRSVEDAAWRAAKKSIPPEHLLAYAVSVRNYGKISDTQSLAWLVQIKSEFKLAPDFAEFLTSGIKRLEQTAAPNAV